MVIHMRWHVCRPQCCETLPRCINSGYNYFDRIISPSHQVDNVCISVVGHIACIIMYSLLQYLCMTAKENLIYISVLRCGNDVFMRSLPYTFNGI